MKDTAPRPENLRNGHERLCGRGNLFEGEGEPPALPQHLGGHLSATHRKNRSVAGVDTCQPALGNSTASLKCPPPLCGDHQLHGDPGQGLPSPCFLRPRVATSGRCLPAAVGTQSGGKARPGTL